MSSLTVTAPDGAHFEFDEVKTKKGQESLGQVPLLTWDTVEAMRVHYTDEGVCNIVNGTSFRVSCQAIARRARSTKKEDGSAYTDDEIAQMQINFKPGKRAIGQSTPVSRAARAAKSAAEKVDGDAVAKLLEAIASGKLTLDEINTLTS